MRTGAPPQHFCKRGHLMKQTRRFHPNGDSYCSACKATRTTNDRKKHPQRFAAYCRRSNLRRKYGVTEEFADRPCGICGRVWSSGKRHHIDHDHKTGLVRGVFCHRCNTGIGLLGEENLASAIKYITLSKAGKSKKTADKKGKK